MKKRAYLVFGVLLTFLALVGCKNNTLEEKIDKTSHASMLNNSVDSSQLDRSNTVRICLDTDHHRSGTIPDENTILYEFENTLKQTCGLADVNFEYLPASGPERESMVNRIRVELMSGGGPDVFIITCHTMRSSGDGSPLFPISEKIMANDMFLPLDEYIDNAQYAEWDKFTQSVMEAGRDEEGQQIVPLAYTLPVLYYQRQAENDVVPVGMTFDNMLNDAYFGPLLRRLTRTKFLDETGNVNYTNSNHLLYLFDNLADYNTEELLFSKEDLNNEMDTLFNFSDDLIKNPESIDFPHDSTGLDPTLMLSISTSPGYSADVEYEIMSVPSNNGGYTALITSYAAINRNTSYPQEAFTVIDTLLRTDVQQKFKLYTDSLHYGGFPVHEQLCSGAYPAGVAQREFSDNVFSELSEIRSNISAARFYGTLDAKLHELIFLYSAAIEKEESTDDVVASVYRNMEQSLRE